MPHLTHLTHLTHLLRRSLSLAMPAVARRTLPLMCFVATVVAAGSALPAAAQTAAAKGAATSKIQPDCKLPGNEQHLDCLGSATNSAMRNLVDKGCAAGACGSPPGVNVDKNLMRTLPAERFKLLEATAIWLRMNGITQSEVEQLSRSPLLK